MKLRIEKNSIRLRLRPSDVAEFLDAGAVKERLELGGGAGLGYALRADEEAGALRASFANGELEVAAPRTAAFEWATGPEVSMSAEQGTNGERLTILVEKDFQCMHKDREGDGDAYPNPMTLVS